ncbi:MAG: FAD-binding oxidoreductase, partial [Acidimicrobiia bacterium]
TVIAAGAHAPQARLDQWAVIKQAAADALLAHGGTITHHHAVGRDHRPWYDRQRPDLFADALRAAKRAVDPDAILNPGVLLDADHRNPRTGQVLAAPSVAGSRNER